MKLKIIRQSGQPISPEKADEFQKEWEFGFDNILKKHGKLGDETPTLLNELEKNLQERYNDLTVVDFKLPKSQKAWIEELSKYGNIMLTTNLDTGDLVAVILDQPWS